jgi:hypothetical protein
VRRRRPEIGVVVTSGRMAPGRDGLPAGARYLAKPMSNAALLAALREVMLPRSLRGDAEDGSPGDDPEAGRGAAHDPGSGILPASLLMDDPATLPHAPLSEIRPALDPEE